MTDEERYILKNGIINYMNIHIIHLWNLNHKLPCGLEAILSIFKLRH